MLKIESDLDLMRREYREGHRVSEVSSWRSTGVVQSRMGVEERELKSASSS